MHLDQSEVRRNRSKFALEMRKQNREEIFLKRRYVEGEKDSFEEEITGVVVIDERFRSVVEETILQVLERKQLGAFIAQLSNPNPVIKHQAVLCTRKIVSGADSQETIQELLDSGVLPLIISLVREKEYPQVRFEASWILSNIAAGTSAQCQAIVDKGGIDALFELLEQSHYKLNEQGVWALGNIAGDSTKYRDILLLKGAMPAFIKLAERSKQKCIIKRTAWAISNLCRGSPLPKYEAVRQGIATLARIILSDVLADDELSDCLWAISSHSSEGQKSRIQKLVEVANFVACLINICKTNPKPAVYVPALRIIGNVSIGNELHTEQILKGEVLDLLYQLLHNQKKTIRRQACWIISNICGGTASQVKQVIFRNQILLKVSSMLQVDEIDVRKEVCYIFRNMAHVGDKKQVLSVIIDLNIVEGVMNLIKQDDDSQAIEIALKCLFELLNVGIQENGENLILKKIESTTGCLDRLQSLQHHKSQEVYKGVVNIFQTFFILEEAVM